MDSRGFTVLVINPGSTSTKVALFAGGGGSGIAEIRSQSFEVDPSTGADSAGGLRLRSERIDEFLSGVTGLDCVAARGGMVRPIPCGVYRVNRAMIEDLLAGRYGEHPSNLGAPLAAGVGDAYGCPAIVADPVGVDEFLPEARLSGLSGIERKSFSHALNLRATARRAAVEIRGDFAESRFIGVHLGGGISVAAMVGGRIIDVNNSNEGGPFTPQRTGTLPVLQLVDLCFSGEFRGAEELKRRLTSEGGLVSYLGTDSVQEVIGRIDGGDPRAKAVMDAMVYQIGKEIGAMAAVLSGRVDRIVLTGGFARSPVSDWISERISWIAPVLVYPGEGEMTALAEAAVRFLSGVEEVREY